MAAYELNWREDMMGHKLLIGMCFTNEWLRWEDCSMYETISCDEYYAVFIPLNWTY